MPCSQFFEWLVYDSIEPIGQRRGDLQAAMVAQTVANMLKDPKQKPFTLDQFMLKFIEEPEPPKRQQTVEEQMAIWQAITIAQNASLPNA